MSNPFQEQFLKAGLVSKEQVKKANQKKGKKNRQQQRSQQAQKAEAARSKQQQAAKAKAERDRELNQRKQEQAKKKAISIEIDQLIRDNRLKRDKDCELPYNFEHRNKINKIYLNADMKQRLIDGKLGIARIEGRYELVPLTVAEKIQQRNDKRVIMFEPEAEEPAEDDPYAEYQIPDDLIW
jgi:uncharacterized protein YaiL (DUF2058 family)